MKHSIDFYAILFGSVASFLKARKMKLKFKQLLSQVIIGALLAFFTLGILDWMFGEAHPRVKMFISFVVGWTANELTELFDKAVKDGYIIGKSYFQRRNTPNNED
jgi:hypothetical protein